MKKTIEEIGVTSVDQICTPLTTKTKKDGKTVLTLTMKSPNPFTKSSLNGDPVALIPLQTNFKRIKESREQDSLKELAGKTSCQSSVLAVGVGLMMTANQISQYYF